MSMVSGRCLVCGNEGIIHPSLSIQLQTEQVGKKRDMADAMYHSDGVPATVCDYHTEDEKVIVLRLVGPTLRTKEGE